MKELSTEMPKYSADVKKQIKEEIENWLKNVSEWKDLYAT